MNAIMRSILLLALFIISVSSFKLTKVTNGQSRLLGKICPIDDDPQDPTHFADPTDCHNFYKCDNGVPVLRHCPSDLWWSSEENRCEHHENSDCGNPTTQGPEGPVVVPEPNETLSEEELEGPSELPEGCPAEEDSQNPTHLPDPTDCRRFYKCDNGVPVLRRCPADLWWSSAANRCEHQESSDCGNPGGINPTEAPESAEVPEPNETPSEEEVEQPSELPEGCPAEEDSQNPTHLPDPTDCRRFYKCDNGVPVLRRCPADLWWSSAANRCEHQESSDCGNPGGINPTEAPESAEVPEPNETPSEEDVEQPSELPEGCPAEEDSQNPTHLPDPTDCRRFYKCDNGVPVLRRCPADLWWSSAANRCEHQESSDCGNPGGINPTEAPESAEVPEPNETGSNETPSEEEVEQPSELPEGCPAEEDSQNPTHLPDPTDCRRFYKCDNGVPVLRRCPADLWWSSAANRCEHQESSDCGNPGGINPTEAPESAEVPEPNETGSNETPSEEEVEQPSELPEGCPAEEDSQNPTHLPDPTDCRRFYKCDNGVPVLRRCPADLWWSSAANRCEHQENSDCGNPGGINPTEAPESAEVPEPNETGSNETPSEEEVEQPSELPEGCPAEEDSQNPTHLPDPTDCRRFYKCDNGVPVLRRCPADLWWSSAANRCEHQESSDCGNPGGINPTEAPESAEVPEPNETGSNETSSEEEVEQPSELPEGCPAEEDSQNPTHLPDPTDCRRFYKCDNGVPVLRRCPADLWWSSVANRCEHQENSDCGNPGGISPPEAPESAEEPEPNETVSTETPGEEEVEGPTELPEGCPAEEDSQNPTHLPDPTDCGSFYKCDNGVPVLRRCPEELWWSSVSNRCEHEENSDCGNPGGINPTEVPESAEEPETTESDSNEVQSEEEVEGQTEFPEGCPAEEDSQNPTHLPDPTDCRRFYKCDNGVPVLRRCPADLWWSSAADRCEHQDNSDCGNPGGINPTEAPASAEEPEPNETVSNETPSEEEVEGQTEFPEGCPAEEDSQNPTHLPDPTDCRRFYKCDNGVPVLRRCPADLWWSSAANRCEHEENSDCGNPGGINPTEAPASAEEREPNEGQSEEGLSELPEGCPADEDPQNPTLLPDSSDCRRFYKCDNGTPVVWRCPAGLWWNSATNYCDFPEKSDCAGQ